MKNQSYVIWIYALLLLIGGYMGFSKAGSLTSIISASVFAFLLLCCGIGVWKDYKAAYRVALGLIVVLVGFFSYRFWLTHAFMPAGLMIILSLLVLVILLANPRHYR